MIPETSCIAFAYKNIDDFLIIIFSVPSYSLFVCSLFLWHLYGTGYTYIDVHDNNNKKR